MNGYYILIGGLAAWTLLNSFVTAVIFGLWVKQKDILFNLEEIKHLLVLTKQGTHEPSPDELRRFFAEPARPGDVTFHIPSILKGWPEE